MSSGCLLASVSIYGAALLRKSRPHKWIRDGAKVGGAGTDVVGPSSRSWVGEGLSPYRDSRFLQEGLHRAYLSKSFSEGLTPFRGVVP